MPAFSPLHRDGPLEDILFPEILQQNIHSREAGGQYIVAIDEVGRGSLFGPVTVAGVLLPLSEWQAVKNLDWFTRVDDSKKLNSANRGEVAALVESGFSTAIAHVSVGFIDKYNINRAIQYGTYRVVQQLARTLNGRGEIARVFIDGNYRFQFPLLNMTKPMPPLESIVKGDSRCFTIACASNIAKVRRDALIASAGARFPQYGLEKNAGYGTKTHRQAILEHGSTRYHRKSFLKKIAAVDSSVKMPYG